MPKRSIKTSDELSGTKAPTGSSDLLGLHRGDKIIERQREATLPSKKVESATAATEQMANRKAKTR